MKIYQNPDSEYAAEVKRQLKDNNGFCPCKLERSKDTKCKCKEFRDQVANGAEGACHCGLWIAENEKE